MNCYNYHYYCYCFYYRYYVFVIFYIFFVIFFSGRSGCTINWILILVSLTFSILHHLFQKILTIKTRKFKFKHFELCYFRNIWKNIHVFFMKTAFKSIQNPFWYCVLKGHQIVYIFFYNSLRDYRTLKAIKLYILNCSFFI